MRSDRTKLDVPTDELFLEFMGKELLTAVCLKALDRKWQAFLGIFQESQRAAGGTIRMKLEHTQPSAIVNRSVLIQAVTDLDVVDLDAFAGNAAGVRLWRLAAASTIEGRHLMTRQDLVNGWQRSRPVMQSTQLTLQTPHTQSAFSQREDPIHLHGPKPGVR